MDLCIGLRFWKCCFNVRVPVPINGVSPRRQNNALRVSRQFKDVIMYQNLHTVIFRSRNHLFT
jgi:hypothetical protein